MMTSAEMKFVVPRGAIVNEEVMPDDITHNNQKDIFKLVPASELRLDDAFMQYEPNTDAERNFKELVETAIKRGLKDFWSPVCDHSLDNNGRICYEPGKMPAVGKSYNWWARTAKKFKPEQGSRLGTKSEYVAFLATLIKELVATGWKVADAWYSVCPNSKELGALLEF